MAVELATAYVSLIPSARGISGALTKELRGPTAAAATMAGTTASRRFGDGFAKGIKRASVLAAGGLAVIGVAGVKMGIDLVKAAEESIKVTKQTNAVIKSTGGVAGVTAGHVAKLAEQLSKKAGVDDELIQSGANVLLTFTNIRNEVGKGNDIFDQATTVALDMSRALGTDLQSNVIQVGKALQDPIRGITALRRVGVNFSEDQVAVIKRLVETGDTLGAQKLILQELTKEFGGSAAAQATSSEKLQVAWDNLKEKLGTELLPVFDAFSTWLTDKGIPLVEDFAGWIRDTLVPALGDIKDWIEDNVVPPLQTMWGVFHDDLLPVMEDVANWIGDELVPRLEDLKDALFGVNDEAGDGGPSLAGWAAALAAIGAGAGLIAAAAAPLIPVIKGIAGVFGFLGFAATTAFNLILKILPFAHIAALALIFRDQISSFIGGAWDRIRDFFTQGGAYIADQWQQRWDQIRGTAVQWWQNISGWFASVWGAIRDFFTQGGTYLKETWQQTWNRITATLSAWWASTSAWFAALPGRLQAFFASAGRWLLEGGKAVLRGLWAGIDWIWDHVIYPWFVFLPSTFFNFFIGASRWLLEGGKNILRGLWNGIKQIWGDVVDWFKDLPGKILSALGISSPPRWAIEAGKWILRGITKGLGLGVGNVMDFMGKLAGNFTGALKDAWSGLTEGEPGWAFGALTQGMTNVVELGRKMAAALGWTGSQWSALFRLWQGESGWNPSARNPSSGAYGIPQALPPGKMGPAAQASNRNVMSRAAAQIAWGLSYIRGRYGSPANALAMWQSRSPHWYQQGAWRTRAGPGFIHDDEMVIPAGLATALRALPGGPGGGGTAGGSLIGTVNVYATTVAEGRAAAKGFLDVLDRRRIRTDARIA